LKGRNKIFKVPKVKEFRHFVPAGQQVVSLMLSMHKGCKLPVALGYQLARRRRTITLGILGTLAHFRHLQLVICAFN